MSGAGKQREIGRLKNRTRRELSVSDYRPEIGMFPVQFPAKNDTHGGVYRILQSRIQQRF